MRFMALENTKQLSDKLRDFGMVHYDGAIKNPDQKKLYRSEVYKGSCWIYA